MYQPKSLYGVPFTLKMCQDQVGEGWHGLVEECYNICVENEVDITQVKEKYGTLRFYILGGSDEVYNKIEDICARSALICEECGNAGKTVDLGWYFTLCSDCEKRLLDENKNLRKRV
jgi:hypothetical protein